MQKQVVSIVLFTVFLIFSCQKSKAENIKVSYPNDNQIEIEFEFEETYLSGKAKVYHIAVPKGSEIQFEITEMEQKIVSHQETSVFSEFIQTGKTTHSRGLDIVELVVSPLQFDAKTNQWFWIDRAKVIVYFSNRNSNNERLRNPLWDGMIGHYVINPESLTSNEHVKNYGLSGKDTGAEYLIISPNNAIFQQWADSIKLFRNTQGILTQVVTLDDIGGNTSGLIENFIDDAYNTWDIPPIAVLLLGDDGTDPANSVSTAIYENYCASDNIYGDVDGDNLPDIIVSRLPASTATELETMLSRILAYERNPSTDFSFYSNPITSCYFEVYRWNLLLVESFAGYLEYQWGKTPNRLYVAPEPLPEEWSLATNSAGLISYFGPDGLGYIPASPTELTANWSATAQDMLDGINAGAFMVINDATGSETAWSDPPFTISEINNLTNTNFPFVFSVNSLTGKFNYGSDCLAETFLKQTYNGQPAGAVGVIAASEITYTTASEIYAWGVLDHLFINFLPESTISDSYYGLPAFANAAGKYYLEFTNLYSNTGAIDATDHLFHYFGDAFTSLYSGVPQNLMVEHEPEINQGQEYFTVNADEGVRIGLSLDGELFASAISGGNDIDFLLPDLSVFDTVLLVATYANHFRYEAEIPVVLGTGTSQLSVAKIVVYPNPCQGRFTIQESPWHFGTSEVRIFNANGLEIGFTKNLSYTGNLSIDLKEHPAGVYYIFVESAGSSVVEKVVVY